jgi:aspartate 1-decarboxylase
VTAPVESVVLEEPITMFVTLLKAKLHRACVTHAEVDYEGSCAIDGELLDAAGIHDYEQIEIYNVTNGERFSTYAIRGEVGSRIISVNGAAAHKASPGDRVIICAYGSMDENEVVRHQPRLLYMDEHNRVKNSRNAIPVQAA